MCTGIELDRIDDESHPRTESRKDLFGEVHSAEERGQIADRFGELGQGVGREEVRAVLEEGVDIPVHEQVRALAEHLQRGRRLGETLGVLRQERGERTRVDALSLELEPQVFPVDEQFDAELVRCV